MITFLRKIRMSLVESLSANEGAAKQASGTIRKYLIYAIGEIALVVIGILIALQINNWNESRKSKKEFQQSLLALSEDIKNDTSNIQSNIRSLERQVSASTLLIPILESKNPKFSDSLEFIQAFMALSNAANVDFNTEIWDEMRTSGVYKTYASPNLIRSIQEYYNRYKRTAKNWQNAYRNRIEMRELKYEFLSQGDLDSIRSEPSRIPSHSAFTAILNQPEVLTLTKSIKHTSFLFSNNFSRCKQEGEKVLQWIELESQ